MQFNTEGMVEAIEKQFMLDQILEKDFHKMLRKVLKQNTQSQFPNSVSIPRSEDAMWHITCHSDKDKLWAEAVMKELGCTKYRLYATIDECLEPFKNST